MLIVKVDEGRVEVSSNLKNPPVRVAMHDPQRRSGGAVDRRRREGNVGACLDMLLQKQPVIHLVKLVAAED